MNPTQTRIPQTEHIDGKQVTPPPPLPCPPPERPGLGGQLQITEVPRAYYKAGGPLHSPTSALALTSGRNLQRAQICAVLHNAIAHTHTHTHTHTLSLSYGECLMKTTLGTCWGLHRPNPPSSSGLSVGLGGQEPASDQVSAQVWSSLLERRHTEKHKKRDTHTHTHTHTETHSELHADTFFEEAWFKLLPLQTTKIFLGGMSLYPCMDNVWGFTANKEEGSQRK